MSLFICVATWQQIAISLQDKTLAYRNKQCYLVTASGKQLYIHLSNWLGIMFKIYFQDYFSFRIHFGMNGSLRINLDASQNRSGALAVLEIQLTADLICFYDATVELR